MNTLIDSSSLQETEDILILILSLFLFILQSNFVVCYSISIFNAFSLQGAKNKQKKVNLFSSTTILILAAAYKIQITDSGPSMCRLH